MKFMFFHFSTKSMRNDGGYEVIKKAIEKLGLKHKEHIAAYGEGNERRLTGRHETADINTFLWVDFFIHSTSQSNKILQSFSKTLIVEKKNNNAYCFLFYFLAMVDREWRTVELPLELAGTQRKLEKAISKTGGLLLTWILMLSPP